MLQPSTKYFTQRTRNKSQHNTPCRWPHHCAHNICDKYNQGRTHHRPCMHASSYRGPLTTQPSYLHPMSRFVALRASPLPFSSSRVPYRVSNFLPIPPALSYSILLNLASTGSPVVAPSERHASTFSKKLRPSIPPDRTTRFTSIYLLTTRHTATVYKKRKAMHFNIPQARENKYQVYNTACTTSRQ